MNRFVFAGAALAATLLAAGSTEAQAYGGYGYGCPGMMGPGMMGPGMMGMMGPGMMGGYGMGPGMMGGGWRGQQSSLNLSASDVRADLERSIAGNPHLKVGAVTQQDETTIIGEIVTTDRGALVQRYAVDRSTGAYRPIQ